MGHKQTNEIPDVPKHQKRAPKKKPYGIEYFSDCLHRCGYRDWYATAKARDQAFDNLASKTEMMSFRTADARKIDR